MPKPGAALVAVVLALTSQIAASRAEGSSESRDSRFVIEREAEGFLRLDRQTGELSYCRIKDSGLSCIASAEERLAWETEIARLETRIAAIEARLEALEAGEPKPERLEPPAAVPERQNEAQGEESAEAELARALDFAERAFQRFFDMVKRMKDDLDRENGGK